MKIVGERQTLVRAAGGRGGGGGRSNRKLRNRLRSHITEGHLSHVHTDLHYPLKNNKNIIITAEVCWDPDTHGLKSLNPRQTLHSWFQMFPWSGWDELLTYTHTHTLHFCFCPACCLALVCVEQRCGAHVLHEFHFSGKACHPWLSCWHAVFAYVHAAAAGFDSPTCAAF